MKNWKNKLMQNYLGFPGKRDEYQKSKINEILADASMLSYYLLGVLILISFIWDGIHQTISLGTFLLIFLLLFDSVYINTKLKKYRVLNTEFTDKKLYRTASRQVKRRSKKFALDFMISMFILMTYIIPFIFGDPIEQDWRKILIYLIIDVVAGVVIGYLTYLKWKKQIKFITDDK